MTSMVEDGKPIPLPHSAATDDNDLSNALSLEQPNLVRGLKRAGFTGGWLDSA
jgi:hypothetical protein